MVYKKLFYILVPIAVLIGVFFGGFMLIAQTIAGKSKIAPLDKTEANVISFTPKTDNLSKELDRLQEYEIIQDSEAAKQYAASHDCGSLPNGQTRSCNSKISDPGEKYYFSKSMGADEIVHSLVGDFTYKPTVKFKIFSNDTVEKIIREVPNYLGRPLGEVYRMRAQFQFEDHIKKILNRVSKEHDFHDFDLSKDEMMYPGIKYNLEGYIGVGDYEITKSIPLTALVRMMVGKFVDLVKPYRDEYMKIVGHKKIYPWAETKLVSFHDLVCLASDLVGEGQLHPEQQPGIASVYWNRISQTHEDISGLNLDATFIYGFINTSQYDPAKKYDLDYQRRLVNIYNTYQTSLINKGAIAQVSKTAWEAILRPEHTNNIYYIHDKNGNIHYAENLKEHNENQEKYGVANITSN